MKKCFLILYIFLVACASNSVQVIDELNISVADLQRVAQTNSPVGIRKQSQNGREFYSEYFALSGGEFVAAGGEKRRHYSIITILGDRRPYSLEVRVVTEARDEGGQFEVTHPDEGIARVISRRVEKALHKRREDRNIIDDFRVF